MQDSNETTGDYGYDEAHDLDLKAGGPLAAPPSPPPVEVATESSDDGEDYGYDLAHDVPKS
jgi:hypothetical protein